MPGGGCGPGRCSRHGGLSCGCQLLPWRRGGTAQIPNPGVVAARASPGSLFPTRAISSPWKKRDPGDCSPRTQLLPSPHGGTSCPGPVPFLLHPPGLPRPQGWRGSQRAGPGWQCPFRILFPPVSLNFHTVSSPSPRLPWGSSQAVPIPRGSPAWKRGRLDFISSLPTGFPVLLQFLCFSPRRSAEV